VLISQANAFVELERRLRYRSLEPNDHAQCTRSSVAADGLVSDAARWADHGLAALPLEMQGTGTTYANTAVALEPGRRFAVGGNQC